MITNELLTELESNLHEANVKVKQLKYFLSMVNKLSLAGGDVAAYLDEIDIDKILEGFDADLEELPK